MDPIYKLLDHHIDLDEVISSNCRLVPYKGHHGFEIDVLFKGKGKPLTITGYGEDVDILDAHEKFIKAWRKHLKDNE